MTTRGIGEPFFATPTIGAAWLAEQISELVKQERKRSAFASGPSSEYLRALSDVMQLLKASTKAGGATPSPSAQIRPGRPAPGEESGEPTSRGQYDRCANCGHAYGFHLRITRTTVEDARCFFAASEEGCECTEFVEDLDWRIR